MFPSASPRPAGFRRGNFHHSRGSNHEPSVDSGIFRLFFCSRTLFLRGENRRDFQRRLIGDCRAVIQYAAVPRFGEGFKHWLDIYLRPARWKRVGGWAARLFSSNGDSTTGPRAGGAKNRGETVAMTLVLPGKTTFVTKNLDRQRRRLGFDRQQILSRLIWVGGHKMSAVGVGRVASPMAANNNSATSSWPTGEKLSKIFL